MRLARRKPSSLLLIAYLAMGLMVVVAAYILAFRPQKTAATSASRSPLAFDITPDGKSLVIATDGGVLVLVDRASGKILKELSVEGITPSDPALSPDGRVLAYTAASGWGKTQHLYVWEWRTPGARPRQLTKGADSDFGPAFSPDGKRIAFSRMVPFFALKTTAPVTPYVMDADGTNLRRLTAKMFEANDADRNRTDRTTASPH